MHLSGKNLVFSNVNVKNRILGCSSVSGPILGVQLRVFSTQLDKSVQTTARQAAQGPRKPIEYRHPRSGSSTLQDISEKPYSAALGGFWLNFERSNARSLDPVGQIIANCCITTRTMTKEVD
jgi:hypothetical protein